jgi:hypothetical protein
MSRIGRRGTLLVLIIGMAVGAGVAWNVSQPSFANQAGSAQAAGAVPNYSVVMTDGTHLIVTENRSNSLYFYTIEKDAEIGSELKLRARVDLTQVGKNVITPTVHFKKKQD